MDYVLQLSLTCFRIGVGGLNSYKQASYCALTGTELLPLPHLKWYNCLSVHTFHFKWAWRGA